MFIEEGHYVVCYDFLRVFDRLPNRRLLAKLAFVGITGHLLRWIEKFQTGRTMAVRLRFERSTRYKPQARYHRVQSLVPIFSFCA